MLAGCLTECLKGLITHGDLRGALDTQITLRLLQKYGRNDKPKSVSNTLKRLADERSSKPWLTRIGYGLYTPNLLPGALLLVDQKVHSQLRLVHV